MSSPTRQYDDDDLVLAMLRGDPDLVLRSVRHLLTREKWALDAALDEVLDRQPRAKQRGANTA
jgi:hypothetical protein